MSVRSRASVGLALTAICAVTGLACQWIVGLDEPTGVPAKDGAAAAPRVDPCPHAAPPKPPALHAGDEGDTYWMVIRSIALPPRGDGGAGSQGFDLDSACTCASDLHDGGPPCRSPAGTTSCDLPSGVDDAFAHASDPSMLAEVTQSTNDAIERGGGGLLVYVSGYNGGPDDDTVGVALVPTDGLYSNVGCDGQPRPGPPPGSGTVVPAHDGCDHWHVRAGSLQVALGSVYPIDGVGTGYVAGYRLVSTGRVLSLPIDGRAVSVGTGIFTARFVEVAIGGQRAFQLVDGLAASRAPGAAFASALAEERCARSTWPAFEQMLCRSLDTTAVGEEDFQAHACDAFSLTWGFTAEPATYDEGDGGPGPPVPPAAACADISIDALCSR
jgi:hypothetical protein